MWYKNLLFFYIKKSQNSMLILRDNSSGFIGQTTKDDKQDSFSSI